MARLTNARASRSRPCRAWLKAGECLIPPARQLELTRRGDLLKAGAYATPTWSSGQRVAKILISITWMTGRDVLVVCQDVVSTPGLGSAPETPWPAVKTIATSSIRDVILGGDDFPGQHRRVSMDGRTTLGAFADGARTCGSRWGCRDLPSEGPDTWRGRLVTRFACTSGVLPVFDCLETSSS